MGHVRILWGAGTGPTALSSYDAALAAANVHDYNLVRVSSVLPVGTTVDVVGTAPDLGPLGEKLTAVEARETGRVSRDGTAPSTDADETGRDPDDAVERRICAGLGWAQAENGRGIVYEGTGTDLESVRRRIDRGLRAGCALRDFAPTYSDRVLVATDGTGTRIERGAEVSDATLVRARDSDSKNDRRAESDASGADGSGESEHVTAVVLAAYGESDPIL